VVLPDTQFYSQLYPEVFHRQTEWIAAHRDAFNIRFVAHEGDITQRNTEVEWRNARAAMGVLNRAGIPYAILPGNHDLGSNQPPTARDRFTLLNNFFRPDDYSSSEAAGLFEPGKLENSWHAFTTPTGNFLVIALEYGPRNRVLQWANAIVASKPEHQTIIVTHAYLYQDHTRYDWTARRQEQKWNPKGSELAQDGDANDGEDMWRKLISRHSNINFVLSGHVLESGTGYLASPGQGGNVVHQILANYQRGCTPDRGYGGGGFLRLMQFLPDGRTVRVKTYSPWYDRWLHDPAHNLNLTLTRGRV
jgi:3',5'-cyclic AMP phosphodiesterase CpdA